MRMQIDADHTDYARRTMLREARRITGATIAILHDYAETTDSVLRTTRDTTPMVVATGRVEVQT